MKKKNKKIPTYGSGKDMYVCTRPGNGEDPQSTCFGALDNPAHGKGAVILYKVYADTWTEALALHYKAQGFN